MKPIFNKEFSFSKKIIKISGRISKSNNTKMLFKKQKKDFTRDRKLTFENMIVLILQK
jgi:hypothetical protein